MAAHGDDDATIDAPGSRTVPSSDSRLAADRQIDLPVHLPVVRRRRARGVGWFAVGFVVALCVVAAGWVLFASLAGG
ncbi:hypothetical protein ASE01_05205 [Nocardioides sp. Root190]|uniref:hypothetical protein n=1 Tax=Nocardioides sp. Root190 TaxID=1736488 RepID=UPI0006F4D9DB|nr:hypothetical protein [Nocardioides sp. Root190]KRB78649.1 hypothetical protein ASE01_05205 [Nocardioides sp. Root190]